MHIRAMKTKEELLAMSHEELPIILLKFNLKHPCMMPWNRKIQE